MSRSGTSCAFRPVHGGGTRPGRRASRSSSSARPTSARTRGKTCRVSETGGLTERRSVDGSPGVYGSSACGPPAGGCVGGRRALDRPWFGYARREQRLWPVDSLEANDEGTSIHCRPLDRNRGSVRLRRRREKGLLGLASAEASAELGGLAVRFRAPVNA